ncbi:MAG: hypothetical protein J6X95_01020 [Treponema sp.]|nr:hypothetical protein [Treponema sp.]
MTKIKYVEMSDKEFWFTLDRHLPEKDMKSQGYDFVLTSTRVDESAQHFYRKLGYKDCGGLLIDIPNYEQPMEMFLIKRIS